MRRLQDLQRLKKVTEATWLSASQVLRKKVAEERAVAARLNGLAADQRVCLDHLSAEAADMALVVSTTRWFRWSEAERVRLNVGLARLRADLGREREVAKRAFARDHALDKLLAELRRQNRDS